MIPVLQSDISDQKTASAGDRGRGRSPEISPTRTDLGHTPSHTTLASGSEVAEMLALAWAKQHLRPAS